MESQPDNMRERLAVLRTQDPAAAVFLEPALGLTVGPPRRPIGPVPEPQVAAWFAAEPEPDLVLIPGIGDTRYVKALLDQRPDRTRLLLMERDPMAAARLFQAIPLESHVAAGTLTLAFGDKAAHFDDRFISMLDLPNSPVIRVFEWPPSIFVERVFYRSSMMEIRNRMRLRTQNMTTLVRLGPLWQYNILRNLPQILENPGVSRLHNQFAGLPALVVAAGPSLNALLPRLKSIQDRFVILAVGTALRPLHQAGIRPDLVLSVDASRKTGLQFSTPCKDLFLVASAMAYPPILKKFRGLFSGHVNIDPIADWLAAIHEPKGTIFGGGTVSATAIDLACRMQCDPIVTIGLDLCMQEDGTTHARDTMYHEHRYKAEHLVRVPGNYTETVPTTDQFRVYIDIIREYVRAHPEHHFININSGGARLGTMQLERPERLDHLAGRPCHAHERIADLHAAYVPPGPAQYATIRTAVETSVTELDILHRESLEAAMLCNQMLLLARNPGPADEPALRAGLTHLEALDQRILAMRQTSQLLEMSLRPVYYTTQRNRDDNAGTSAQAVAAVYKRSRKLYEQVAGAARWTSALLRRSTRDLPEHPPSGEWSPVAWQRQAS